MSSGLYQGYVTHERTTPHRHRFRYRTPFVALDLTEATELDRRLRLFSYNGRALFSLRDSDHLGDDRLPLELSIARRMAAVGVEAIDRVVMVGSLRTTGYVFNPLTLFYCYDTSDTLLGVLAEVSNTFGERHAYCLPTTDGHPRGGALEWNRRKSLHVSPFFGMEQRYLFRLTEPEDTFGAVIDLFEGDQRVFRGAWNGIRRPFSDRSLLSQAVRRPFSTHMVSARIHLQAAKLFVKGVPVQHKPAFDVDAGTATIEKPPPPEPLTGSLPPAPRTPLARVAKGMFLGLLRRPVHGAVELRLPNGRVTHHGDPERGPSATITIHSTDLYRRLAGRGRVGLGEAYMAGDWDTDDLPAALEIMARSAHARGGPGRALNRVKALRPGSGRTTTRESARRDISYHYDLGNSLYDLFLDETLTYSCAYFEDPLQSLADAQRAKNRRLLDALEIGPGDHVLEIGCGWGGFALQAATERGARITGITLSVQQKERAEQRIAEAGLQDRIDIQLVDFRDVSGTYSAIVSIEMLEAVGHKLLAPFFSTCDRLLAPGGRAGVQVICIPDQRYDAYRKGNDWIREYIFPGALLPSLGALTAAMCRGSDLTVRQAEDIGPHYATTLKLWRERFMANLDEAAALGYGPRFARTWEYYLAFCEAGFRIRALQDYQLILGRPLEQ